jgi:hypothetical protein
MPPDPETENENKSDPSATTPSSSTSSNAEVSGEKEEPDMKDPKDRVSDLLLTKEEIAKIDAKIKYFYQLQQQAIRAPPLASAPAPPVALNADAISLVFKYFIYSIYDHYLMLAEREGLEGSVIDRMMKVFLELFAQDNDLLNQELKPFGDLVIHRQHRAKLHHHRQWSALSKEERQVQRVLRRNKLAPVHRLWKEREEEEEEWSSRDVAGAWEEDEEMEDTDDEE